MKIQHLAVIFVIIILPISILLSEYVHTQINTVNLQTSYDSKLLGATYDAVIAFQKNTINSTTSDVATSKIRDIEASANTFMNSISSNFSLSGNSKEAIQTYIPAVVYTLYDGYYIYSKYNNYWGSTKNDPYWENKKNDEIKDQSKYAEDVSTIGVKPYIHYSREYQIPSTNSVFTITYSLDNYITIQGIINGSAVNESGYLIDPNKVRIEGENVFYRYNNSNEIEIEDEVLEEYVDTKAVKEEYGETDTESDMKYKYVKVSGTKYYLNEKQKESEKKDYIFYFGDDRVRKLQNGPEFEKKYFKKSAKEYYRQAKQFTEKIINEYGLSQLESSNASFWDKLPTENSITTSSGIKATQNYYKIFNTDDIEEPTSDFNAERRSVIKYAIEKNLATAIANYNKLSATTTANFQMPKLEEFEWDEILHNPSVISFLQGMNLGTKTYNGYAIVTNTKNLEAVSEDSIYITTGSNDENGQYHRVTEKGLEDIVKKDNNSNGYFNIDFERRASNYDDSGTKYYYPKRQSASYGSIVSQTNVETISEQSSIYKYLEDKPNLAKIYYTALGRERYGLYKTNFEI